jgi:hypothetical protein
MHQQAFYPFMQQGTCPNNKDTFGGFFFIRTSLNNCSNLTLNVYNYLGLKTNYLCNGI